jgi:hypothetical protein
MEDKNRTTRDELMREIWEWYGKNIWGNRGI